VNRPHKAQCAEEKKRKPEEEADFGVERILILAQYTLVLHDFEV
jgi:hypothetical protein